MSIIESSTSHDEPDAPRTAAATICFVACVESGPLEAQTVRLADSLRRFGGRLADSEIIAVTPRFGPPLARETRKRFAELGVRHERIPAHPRYSWYHYLNTPLALAAAESMTDATHMAWIDSDIIFLGEPEALVLPQDVDFTACVTDNGVVGSTGPDSPHEADWLRLFKLLDIDPEQLPWVTTHVENERIRMYFQAGLFVYKRDIGFSDYYLKMCEHVLDSRFGFAHNGEHFTDQVCLGLAMFKSGLRWRHLPYSHNFPMASFLPEQDGLDSAEILHYHDSMEPHFFDTVLERLHETHPEVHEWLRTQPPLTDPAPAPSRLLRQALRVARGVPRRRYRSRMLAA